MPNYTAVQNRLNSISAAASVLEQLKACYQQAKLAQASLLLYQAGTDTVFNSAIDQIFSGAEKLEMLDMTTQLDALVSDWEANHAAILEVTP